jgi:hypothetical protein
MSNDRPITSVRFHSPVVLGTREHDAWFEDKPGSSALANHIKARPGNTELGEQRSSVVFEVRLGGKEGDDDVEVPASNLKEVHRRPPEMKQPAGGRK